MASKHGLTLIAMSLCACGALDEFEEVIIEETTIRMTDGNGISGPFSPQYGAGFSDIDLSQSRTFQNEGISPDDVDAIFVKSVVLEMSTGANDPAIDQLAFYIAGMDMTVSAEGQPTATMATLANVPMTATANLDVPPNLNLKPYAVAPAMTVGANVMLKEPRGVIVTLKTTVTLLIDINLLGQ